MQATRIALGPNRVFGRYVDVALAWSVIGRSNGIAHPINPTSRIWHAGETIRVHIAGRYIREAHWIEPLIWETDNAGEHVFHTGGRFESYLQIPVIPPKYNDDYVFEVDEAAHPTHPIF